MFVIFALFENLQCDLLIPILNYSKILSLISALSWDIHPIDLKQNF